MLTHLGAYTRPALKLCLPVSGCCSPSVGMLALSSAEGVFFLFLSSALTFRRRGAFDCMWYCQSSSFKRKTLLFWKCRHPWDFNGAQTWGAVMIQPHRHWFDHLWCQTVRGWKQEERRRLHDEIPSLLLHWTPQQYQSLKNPPLIVVKDTVEDRNRREAIMYLQCALLLRMSRCDEHIVLPVVEPPVRK